MIKNITKTKTKDGDSTTAFPIPPTKDCALRYDSSTTKNMQNYTDAHTPTSHPSPHQVIPLWWSCTCLLYLAAGNSQCKAEEWVLEGVFPWISASRQTWRPWHSGRPVWPPRAALSPAWWPVRMTGCGQEWDAVPLCSQDRGGPLFLFV